MPATGVMKCLGPSTKDPFIEVAMMEMTAHRARIAEISPAGRSAIRKTLASVLLLMVGSGVPAWCSAVAPQRVHPSRLRLAQSERRLRRVPAHISEFGPLAESLALPRCGSLRQPEALLTPDPVLPGEDENPLVRVSFIVGADGRVHSAFVLNSGGPDEDQVVLRAVRHWRYRPALCNGVPTDSEARVRFSIP